MKPFYRKSIFAVLSVALVAVGVAFQNCGEEILRPFPDSMRQKDRKDKIIIDDMVFDEIEPISAGGYRTQFASGFKIYSSRPWVNGRIPILFDNNISQDKRNLFWKACSRWSAVAKISCTPWNWEATYLKVKANEAGCWADVGSGLYPGERRFNFAESWCWNDYSVLHDLGHVLGLIHEHQRSDRDKYVKILWQNMKPEIQHAYVKFDSTENFGPYDFFSVTHYPKDSGSIAYGKNVMEPQAGYQQYLNVMGAKDISANDKANLKILYPETNKNCPSLSSRFKNPLGNNSCEPYYAYNASESGCCVLDCQLMNPQFRNPITPRSATCDAGYKYFWGCCAK